LKYALPVFVCLLLGASSAQAVTLAPHRAIYDLTLLRAEDGANLQAASGRLAFELQGSSCEGYTVSFRMVAKYTPSEGDASLIDTQSTTYEGPDSLEFRHQTKETINGEIKEDSKLKLQRDAIGKPGQGEVTGKDSGNFTVDGEAFLPMQHQLKLMAMGESGGGRDSSLLFDGSDGAKTFRAISFVGKTKAPGSIARDATDPVAAPLKAVAAWPMTVSYFSEDKDQSIPDYQVSFDLYSNGVATGLVLDYGQFALAGKLANLTMYEPTECP
jgi:hypothetical protein